MVKKIPEGFTNVTPSLVLDGAASAIDLYTKAFNAQELYRMEYSNQLGSIMHACIMIGDSKIFLSDINQKMGNTTPSQSNFYVYVDDVDATFKQALKAGLTSLSEVTDMFWGDRAGRLKDSFGIQWTIATHIRDITPEEMEEGRKKMYG